MRVGVPKETRSGEKRVALVPDIINKLVKLGYEVSIESGAGIHAQATDKDYEAAGARIQSDVIKNADIVLSVKANGNHADLIVADRGPGIAEADRGRVLDRFVRLESSRTRPGSGLGLSLVAAVARLHGGTLRLEDNDPGLRAVITLPLKAIKS